MAPTKPKPPKKAGRPSNASKGLQPSSARSKPSSSQVRKAPRRSSLQNKAKQSNQKNVAPQSSSSRQPDSRSHGRPKTNATAKPHSSHTLKRKAEDADIEEDDFDELGPKNYQYLKSRTRKIPQDIIATKWSCPSQQIQDQIHELLKVAKRSVILSRRDEQKRNEAELVLATVLNKVKARLPVWPFPPNTKDVDFDMDRLLERNRILESQLTPALHSVELLKEAIQKEELHLAEEQRDLAILEKNIRREKTRQRDHVTKIHPLLKLPKDFEAESDGAEEIKLIKSDSVTASLVDDADEDLSPLLAQLRRNLESMQGNHAQVQGIDDAIKEAHTALDDVFFRHASSQQYDSI